MCIIASIPQGKQISKATLKRCWENNPHGGGFMFTDGKKVQTFKEMTSFKRYWKAFIDKREQYPNSSFVCHFRISTHGKINETNCHPFLVNDNLGFAHNGIIRNAPTSPDYSDTYMFNKSILQSLPKNFYINVSIMVLIAEYIGSGSKLSFLTSDNKLFFVNEKAGQWDSNGVWFSNGGYKEVKYYDAGGTRVGTYGSSWGASSYNYGSTYKQGSMGFASAVIPNFSKSEPKKIADIDWDAKFKTDKIDKEVVVVAHSRMADRYDINCMFCDAKVTTHVEKNNECCYKCEERYTSEYSI